MAEPILASRPTRSAILAKIRAALADVEELSIDEAYALRVEFLRLLDSRIPEMQRTVRG